MRLGLRAGIAAATLVAASYCAVIVQSAAAETTETTTPRSNPPPNEVTAADATTELPGRSTRNILVDDAHDQVFISMPAVDSVVVTDLDGQITRTITGFTYPTAMTLSDDGSTLFVAQGSGVDAGRIGQIDTQTYQVAQVPLPDDICPMSLAFTGGKVWFSHLPASCPGMGAKGIGVWDPSSGVVTPGVITTPAISRLRALPNRPERLVAYSRPGSIGVYDVSSDTPAVVAEKPVDDGQSDCYSATLIANGDQLVTGCRHSEQEVYNTADLSRAPSIPSSSSSHTVAATPDHQYVAGGHADSSKDGIDVVNVQGGTPGDLVRTYEFSEGALITGPLAFSATGRLFAVTRPKSGGNLVLHVFADATKTVTKLTVNAPKAVDFQGTVTASGTLSYAPGVETTATLTRRDRSGDHDLGTFPVAADGAFSFTDTPDVTGRVVYSVRHAGDETHSASSAKAGVTVRPLPYDVNADGYAETIVGVPGEDLGSDNNAGMFHVLYGSADGASGSGSKSYHQDTPGVPGGAESGDWFGYSNTSGDFNGDGFADIAVSAGAENLSGVTDAGQVIVLYGSPSGLRTDNAESISLNDTFLSGVQHTYFGDALAAGDFTGDGNDDLAIGAAGAGGGFVFVSHGGSEGLSTALNDLEQDTPGVPGTSDGGDLFGWSLSAADVNGDSHDDLAVGAIYDWEDRGMATGSVTVLYAGAYGLTGEGAQRWTKDSAGVPGQPRPFNDQEDGPDMLGHQVTLADFNGDGRPDLAAGAPGAPVWVDGVRKRDAGTVTVLYASDTGKISGANAANLTQQTSGVRGIAGQEDQFGSTLAAGDSNGDEAADLAVYSPADTYVNVIPGASAGLSYHDAKGWTQNTSGIPGSSETGDLWGNSLRFADIQGTGHLSLIVGADGENNGKGAITIIHSNSSGLTAAGATYYSQNSTGISGTPETNDGFGAFY